MRFVKVPKNKLPLSGAPQKSLCPLPPRDPLVTPLGKFHKTMAFRAISQYKCIEVYSANGVTSYDIATKFYGGWEGGGFIKHFRGRVGHRNLERGVHHPTCPGWVHLMLAGLGAAGPQKPNGFYTVSIVNFNPKGRPDRLDPPPYPHLGGRSHCLQQWRN